MVSMALGCRDYRWPVSAMTKRIAPAVWQEVGRARLGVIGCPDLALRAPLVVYWFFA
jgi:hypothetical protein